MQWSVCVQRLHVLLDDVVPLYAQVDEASGFDLLPFAVENVMPRRLVLDCCNQSFYIREHDKVATALLCHLQKQ